MLKKAALVLAGYILALVLAFAAAHIQELWIQDDQVQASSGMWAFGDVILFVSVFSFTALFPTGLAVYFVHKSSVFWKVFAAVSVAIALTGLGAGIMITLGSPTIGTNGRLIWLEVFSILRICATPALAGAFALSALIAPDRVRVFLVLAAAVESLAGILAFVHWFVVPGML